MEALIIPIVFVVGAFVYVLAKFSPDRLWKDAAEEEAQLQAYRDSLCERRDRGLREGWDQTMLSHLDDKLAEVEARLAELSAARAKA